MVFEVFDLTRLTELLDVRQDGCRQGPGGP
jgi:hypothetical protein